MQRGGFLHSICDGYSPRKDCERRRCPGRTTINQSLIRRTSITADLEMAWRKRNHQNRGWSLYILKMQHVNAMMQIKQDCAAPSSPKRCDHDAPSSLPPPPCSAVGVTGVMERNGRSPPESRRWRKKGPTQLHHKGGGNNKPLPYLPHLIIVGVDGCGSAIVTGESSGCCV